MTASIALYTSPSSVIDQAIGVVMRENGCGPRQAASALNAAAQRQHLEVLDVAQAVLTLTFAGAAPVRLAAAS